MSAPAHLTVSAAQAGQKLVQFLGRALGPDIPGSVFMRWIRTGQVRVDGKRAKPFDRVEEGQTVRLPPFALAEAGRHASSSGQQADSGFVQDGALPSRPGGTGAAAPGERQTARGNGINHERSTPFCSPGLPGPSAPPGSRRRPAPPSDAPALPILAETEQFLVIAKPAGLPVHPGSGWTDSIQTRLAHLYAGSGYAPQLAHRLDRDTSGVLLAAKTHRALTAAHEALRKGLAVKEYLCWTHGAWTLSGLGEAVEFTDRLAKTGPPGRERMAKSGPGEHEPLASGPADALTPDGGKYARLAATPLLIETGRTLLRVRLFTGRTHQIRVQLSLRGHPIIGDAKYGGGRPPLFLHAWRLTLSGETFECPPPWTGWAAFTP